MAPKGNAADKAKAQAKAKAIEDKTFGLKNKNKSKAVQTYVKTLQASTNPSQKEKRLAEPTLKDKKKAEEEKKRELDALFAVAIKQPKVPPGVDPKSVVCEFFRHGQCTKGFKCKYSHDLSVERKGAKIDLFTDQRNLEGGEGQKEEGMDEWDQETLERVVREKHGSEKQVNNPTNIICKFFLEAVEKKVYGWFWKCPNGGECKYKHALPPGYVLKSQMKELLEEEAKNVKDVAESIEEERSKVDCKTPITESVFLEWRKKKVEERKRKQDSDLEERRRKGILTGREMFMQEGFTAEDDASATDDYSREDAGEEEARIREMYEQARQNAEAARARAAAGTIEEGEEEGAGAGPSGSGGAGPSTTTTTTHVQLEDHADVFDDDDDDDEELEDDDDLEDEDLDELEGELAAKANVAGGDG